MFCSRQNLVVMLHIMKAVLGRVVPQLMADVVSMTTGMVASASSSRGQKIQHENLATKMPRGMLFGSVCDAASVDVTISGCDAQPRCHATVGASVLVIKS
jgi:hypothetical protein